jgi:hypothetical protein
MMGYGAGIAGAIGIIAVGADVAYNHWDTFKASLGDTAPIQAATGALIQLNEALARKPGEAKEEVGLFTGNLNKAAFQDLMEYVGAWEKADESAKRHQETLKSIADALKDISSIRGQEETEKGGQFRSAVAAYGGGDKLLKDTFEEQAKERGITDPKAREGLRDGIAQEIAKGLNGGDANTELFNKKFQGSLTKEQGREGEAIQKEAIDNQNRAVQDQANRDEKARKDKEKAADKDAKLTDELNRDGQKAQRLAEEERRKNRIDDLQKERDKVMDEKRAINEAAFNDRHASHPTQILSGAKAVVDMYQKSASGNSTEQNARKSHELQETANKKLDGIKAAIDKARHGAFPT